MDKRRDHRRSKEVEDLIFYFAAKSNYRTAFQGINETWIRSSAITETFGFLNHAK
jgi:hypothetical protein